MLIAQRNARTAEAERALAEIQRLRRRWYREPFLMVIAIGIGWTVAILLGVV
jgi:glycerol-3-phosphate dehydrogenase